MSTPYWGELPGPRVTARNRRISDEYHATNIRHSLDSQPLPKQNRASVLTTNTESTFAPIDSPSAASFSAKGLAPRPPSYQRRAPAGAPAGADPEMDASSARPRRPSRHYVDDDYNIAPSGLPAAPEVPRGPPTSYRHPSGNDGLPYTYSAVPRQAPVPAQAAEPELEDYYRPTPDEYYDAKSIEERPVAALPSATVPLGVLGHSRRPSATSSDRRKKLAEDRSPLQKLELTLGSLTKEEKRARMEAAERRVKERIAQRAVESKPAQQRQKASVEQPSRRQDPQTHAPEVLVRHGSSTEHREPRSHQVPPIQNAARAHAHDASDPHVATETAESHQPPEGETGSLPKRNLSFRERTDRNDGIVPTERAAPIGAGISLTRSGSNKLRKEPPGDPWYSRRVEAERRIPSVSRRQPPVEYAEDPALRATSRADRDKALPPDPPAQDLHSHVEQDEGRTMVEASAAGALAAAAAKRFPYRSGEAEQGQQYEQKDSYTAPAIKFKEPTSSNRDPQEPLPDQQAARRKLQRQESDSSSDSSHHHRLSNMLYRRPESLKPGDGLYKPPDWLGEWKKGTVGTLSGALLDLEADRPPAVDRDKPWWEQPRSRRSSGGVYSSKRMAEAFDGEYDNDGAPTRFKPALYLKCGPLLRYCGMRHEKSASRSQRGDSLAAREIWRGSVMIVTQDSGSSYDIAPTLRLFAQGLELLPSPPHDVDGELPQEHVDPIGGHPKLGRQGETLYVRPIDHLDEAKDLSKDETDSGLFESTRSSPDDTPNTGNDLPGSYHSRRKRSGVDGETMQKYKDVRGIRLHAERGYTFWRFNVEVELLGQQQRIAYRINRGPAMGFWVPAKGHAMNIMFHSCNGFSTSVSPDEFSGPDPMWRDVLNTHQSKPFHVMIGGGDQIYNDSVAKDSKMFDTWLDLRNPVQKHTAAFTPEMQDELEGFYLERYCAWFSQGLFGLANSQIPMINMYDDHDVFDGYGSYPHHDMNSPVMCGLGAVAFKYYVLFQHQSILTETEKSEPSWVMGISPGPYIQELSRSVFLSLGGKVALLAVDTRTERTEHDVVEDKTWEKIMNRLYAEMRRGQVEHLLVLLGVPIAYPRLVWLENVLTSRLFDPIKALGKTGLLGNVLNTIDGGVEVLDDLNDHWTAKNHKHERSIIMEDLQDLAIDKSLRVTILSGDVHLAAVGQFYSNPQLGLAKHKDPRYMPNIISSAIVNAPPPDLMADVLNKRNKVHHFDKQTDEDMIPMFHHGVDGKPRNNQRLLPHRNWCSIRLWSPGSTPPPTPPMSEHEYSPSPPPRGAGGIFRRLSLSRSGSQPNRADQPRDSVRGPRPPISMGAGLLRTFSRRKSTSGERPAKLTRTMSLDSAERNAHRTDMESPRRGLFGFGRRPSRDYPDDGGINGQWGEEDESDENEHYDPRADTRRRPSGLRGGAAHEEYSEGDEAYFTARPPKRAQTLGSEHMSAQDPGPPIRPFHRTPTGLSTKQKKKAANYEVDLEGGLDICLNVEVNPKDPAGITVPYRLLVPKLDYEYVPGADDIIPAERQPSGFKRLLSFRKKPERVQGSRGGSEESFDSQREHR